MRLVDEHGEPQVTEAENTAREAIGHAALAAGLAAEAVRCIMLVEGRSDRTAVLACAKTLGRNPTATGCVVVSMSGVTNLPRFLTAAEDAEAAGLIDAPEEDFVRRALIAAGRIQAAAPLASAGFFSCHRDLEDELIRALGVEAAIDVIEELGQGRRLAVLKRQPAQRERSALDTLHRFIGTAAGRKELLAAEFSARIPADRVAPPIRALIETACQQFLGAPEFH